MSTKTTRPANNGRRHGASADQVAAVAGVSVATVSNALNRPERVSADTLERVLEAIHTLGYVRNGAARQLRVGRSSSVGLIVVDISNPFFADLARGVQDEVSRQGCQLLLANSDSSESLEYGYLKFFEEERFRGVILAPLMENLTSLTQLRERGLPVVLVDRLVEDVANSSVAVDDIHGGYLAVHHLLERGRRRIAFVGGPASAPRQVQDRLRGADLAIAERDDAGLEYLGTDGLTVEAGRLAAQKLAKRAQSRQPDAIFAANDLIGIGVIQGLTSSGVNVPDDIAVIGFDDIDYAAIIGVPLSSIRQPAREMGRAAARTLLHESDHPESPHERKVLRPELVVRASTSGTARVG